MEAISSLIVSVFISLAAFIGLPVEASQPISQPTQAVCQSDAECERMELQASMSANEWDAWLAVSDLELYPATPDQILTYVSTLDYLPANLPTGYFAVGSDTQPQLVHLMKWDTTYYA